MDRVEDTIAAVSSPPGRGARGIVRLSGPDVPRCLQACCAGTDFARLAPLAQPRVVSAQFRAHAFRAPVPCEVYLWPEGRSYTGQEVAEIHTMGSAPVLEAVLRTLCARGARLAEPGEFTLRAFLAGRIDLTQAEAVLGVIDAADDRQFRAALEQLAGGLGGPLGRLREELIELLAHLEAGFDFADEDIAFITPEELDHRLAVAAAAVSEMARQMASRAETIEEVRVVLLGRPNVGKSSLFNVLADAAGALVSAVPGTTRDYLRAELHLGGVNCLLVDTAGAAADPLSDYPKTGVHPGWLGLERGETPENRSVASLRPSHGHPNCVFGQSLIELAAQSAAARQAQTADVQLLCLDATRRLDGWERGVLARPDPRRIVVLTKTDAPRRADYSGPAVETSSVTGAGLDRLREALAQLLRAQDAEAGDVVPATAVRCAESLRVAGECLERARALASESDAEELVAAELHAALEALGRVMGTVCAEDVLDRIFQRFCIGK